MRFKLYSIPKHHLIIIKNKLKICIILHVDTNKIAGHEDAIRSIQEMVAQANKVSMWTVIVASEEVILHSRNQMKQ